jgi:hypothetical protein
MSVLRACRVAAVALFAMLAALMTASSAYAVDTNFRYEMNPQHNSGKCIDVPGFATGNSVVLQQFDCNNGANQQFRFVAKPGGQYEIRVGHTFNKCLDVRGGSTSNSAQIIQFDCTGQPNQRFRLLEDSPFAGATSRVQAVHSNKCLDVQGGSNANGAQLIQFTCGTQLNQKFDLVAKAS